MEIRDKHSDRLGLTLSILQTKSGSLLWTQCTVHRKTFGICFNLKILGISYLFWFQNWRKQSRAANQSTSSVTTHRIPNARKPGYTISCGYWKDFEKSFRHHSMDIRTKTTFTFIVKEEPVINLQLLSSVDQSLHLVTWILVLKSTAWTAKRSVSYVSFVLFHVCHVPACVSLCVTQVYVNTTRAAIIELGKACVYFCCVLEPEAVVDVSLGWRTGNRK